MSPRLTLRPRLRRSTILVALAASIAVGALVPQAASAATTTRTVNSCTRQTMAGIGATVYTICLKAQYSYNGSAATGQVAGTSCEVSYPTGVGYACAGHTQGQYWNSQLGAWEEWLNYKVNWFSYYVIYNRRFQNCVYLRVDTKPNGYTTYRNSSNNSMDQSSRNC